MKNKFNLKFKTDLVSSPRNVHAQRIQAVVHARRGAGLQCRTVTFLDDSELRPVDAAAPACIDAQ